MCTIILPQLFEKCSKYGVFSSLYFAVFGPKKKPVFGHFSRRVYALSQYLFY